MKMKTEKTLGAKRRRERSVDSFRKTKGQLLFPVILVYSIILFVLCVSCHRVSENTLISYPIEIWIDGCETMDFFLPLAAVLPIVLPFAKQRKKNFCNLASESKQQKSYPFYQMAEGFFLTVIATAVVYYAAFLFSMQLPVKHLGDNQFLLNYVFGELQVFHPYLFALLWCIWKGMIVGLFSFFASFLALYLNHAGVAALFPFFYCMAENIITGHFGVSRYSIVTSFVLNRLSPACMTPWNYLAGVLIFLCFAAILLFLLQKKAVEKEKCCA